MPTRPYHVSVFLNSLCRYAVLHSLHVLNSKIISIQTYCNLHASHLPAKQNKTGMKRIFKTTIIIYMLIIKTKSNSQAKIGRRQFQLFLTGKIKTDDKTINISYLKV